MHAHKFEGLLTVDQNIEFQQNIKASGIALIIVVCRTNRLKELRPLAGGILRALDTARPGQVVRVTS